MASATALNEVLAVAASPPEPIRLPTPTPATRPAANANATFNVLLIALLNRSSVDVLEDRLTCRRLTTKHAETEKLHQ